MRDGSVAGFKYFMMQDTKRISIKVSGRGMGVMQVSDREDFCTLAAEITIRADRSECHSSASLCIQPGVHALYFRFRGCGAVNFHCFELE